MKFTPAEIQRALEELTEDIIDKQMAIAIGGQTPLNKSAQNSGQGQAKAVGDTAQTLEKAKSEGRKANQSS